MNIVDILKQFGISHKLYGEHHHATTDWIQVDCPWCSPNSNHFRLGLHRGGRAANCYLCGHQRILDSLVEITGAKRSEVWNLLKDSTNPPLEEEKRRNNKLIVPPNAGMLLQAHRQYLINRGFDPDALVRLWGIGGIGIDSKLMWRVYIPVIVEGQTVSWTTRSLVDEGPRYINSPKEHELISLKHTLYGIDYVRHATVVVEGCIDAWRIGPGAVATFGLAYTPAQLTLLSKIPVRCVAFDNEIVAQKTADRLCRELQSFPGVTYRAVIHSSDPGSANQQEVEEIRNRFLQD